MMSVDISRRPQADDLLGQQALPGDLVRVRTFSTYNGRTHVVCDVIGIYVSCGPRRVNILTSTGKLYVAYFVERDGDVIDVIQPVADCID